LADQRDIVLGGLVRIHSRVEIGDHVFERGNRVLDGGDLHQFMRAQRVDPPLERDDQLAPLFLQLNQRQAVVGLLVVVAWAFHRSLSIAAHPKR
jgi:hypothetical protein